MDIEPNDLLLFARVVNEGSFSRAAERLNVPKSSVSRRVAALEEQLGERLLLRTTRKLTLTDLGQAVLEHAHHIVEDVSAAASLAQNRQGEPRGRLRVTMPGDLAINLLPDVLSQFVRTYPRVTLDLDLSARFVDLIAENFDLAIRVGPLRSEASLAARRLAVFTTSLYAAPAYLSRRGAPPQPQALLEHELLPVLARDGGVQPWTLHRAKERWQAVPTLRATANSPEVLMRMALQGAGIAVVNDGIALPYLQRGELAPVLPDWHLEPVEIWAVFPGRRLMPSRTRVFIDLLVARFAGAECKEMEANIQRSKSSLRNQAVPAAARLSK